MGCVCSAPDAATEPAAEEKAAKTTGDQDVEHAEPEEPLPTTFKYAQFGPRPRSQPANCHIARLPLPVLAHIFSFLPFASHLRAARANAALCMAARSPMSLPPVVDACNRSQAESLARLLHNGALRTVTGLNGCEDTRVWRLMRGTLRQLYVPMFDQQDPIELELPALRVLHADVVYGHLNLPSLEELSIRTCESDCNELYGVWGVSWDVEKGALPRLRTLRVGSGMECGWPTEGEALCKLGSALSLHWRFNQVYSSYAPQLARYREQLIPALVEFRGPWQSLEDVQALAACPRLTALCVTVHDQGRWPLKASYIEALAASTSLRSLDLCLADLTSQGEHCKALCGLTGLRELGLSGHPQPHTLPFAELASGLPNLSRLTVAICKEIHGSEYLERAPQIRRAFATAVPKERGLYLQLVDRAPWH